ALALQGLARCCGEDGRVEEEEAHDVDSSLNRRALLARASCWSPKQNCPAGGLPGSPVIESKRSVAIGHFAHADRNTLAAAAIAVRALHDTEARALGHRACEAVLDATLHHFLAEAVDGVDPLGHDVLEVNMLAVQNDLTVDHRADVNDELVLLDVAV